MFLSMYILFVIFLINSGESLPQNSPEEYLMTSARIDGVNRSNICGDGYRIEGALLRSYPYSKNETYLPYENCSMTFQSRRQTNSILIRILILDINDISNGRICFDTLHFYKSFYVNIQDRLNSVECGQLTEANNFSIISSTGIVTAHFITDSGNVNGLGFKVVLTSFRYPNQTHPCNPNDDEYLCHSGECISTSLLHDGIPHCPDKSDEESSFSTSPSSSSSSSSRSWHVKTILIILLLLLFLLLMVIIFFLRHYFHLSSSTKSYVTMTKTRKVNGMNTKIIYTKSKTSQN